MDTWIAPRPAASTNASRLLATASYLIDCGRLLAACDALELASGMDLDERQVAALSLIAARGRVAARAEREGAQRPPLRCRVLPFPSSRSPKRRSASLSP